jgi:hypothetical protein
MIRIRLPLKEIVIDPSNDVDLAALPADEATAQLLLPSVPIVQVSLGLPKLRIIAA